jgi:hypothetical protein
LRYQFYDPILRSFFVPPATKCNAIITLTTGLVLLTPGLVMWGNALSSGYHNIKVTARRGPWRVLALCGIARSGLS